ncbi:SRPBCC family protein [Streptosporangium sp. 'caverna']|uniref:SRPBCC family protein n=1 Tax=Streptosporangium sp. 'caverna' TaxID=2202249 RepID=UPI000D7E457C|nr:SRPBCC family protein [Streptosporangium sp. 'caverna']AWS45088.1 carbon monoxide dehydrogenase [Streptosporangium sp. 'caverna']
MKIDNEFTVSVPIGQAWAVLTDLEGIAPCMPGAQLTGVDGDVYSGKVKIKVGPVVSEYAGTVRFVEKDDTNHRAVIDAKGRDSRGAGNASAVITAQLRADGARTVVTVDTDLKISGRIAQFGNGMIKEISGKLLGQFVDCLEGKLAAGVPETPAAVPEAPATIAGVSNAPAAATGSPDSVPETPAAAADSSAGVPEAMATGSPDIAQHAGDVQETSAQPASSSRETSETGAASPGTVKTSTALPETVEAGTAPQETGHADTQSRGTIEAGVASPEAGEAGAAGRRVIGPAVDAAPLDVMSIAGSSIYKRVLPVVALVVVVAVVVYLVVS